MSAGQKTIGIVAGWGRYPELVAEELLASNHRVVVAGIRDHASEKLKEMATDFHWFGIAKLGHFQKYFLRHQADSILLAGKLFKHRVLFQRFALLRHLPDYQCIKAVGGSIVWRSKDARDDTVLSAVVNSFEKRGLNVIAGTDVAPGLLAEPGVLTKHQPSKRTLQDLRFGWKVAKQSGLYDIGQSVTVRDGTVIAVEAIEGTDGCIARSGELCHGRPFSLIKVAKPNQDHRFDLPTIGLLTLEKLHAAKGNAICVEANQTILIDRKDVIDFANRHRIAIVSWTEADAAGN